MQKKPVIGVTNKATAYRAESGLSSVLAKDIHLFDQLSERGRMKDFAALIMRKWCGRGDLNSHVLRPTDFKTMA